jgi:DNA-binding CsgD family transcriptional regulator
MLDGIAATQAIKRECPATAILLLTIHENLCCLLEALRAGASGFVLKDATQQELVRALRQALQGEVFLHPELVPDLLTQLPTAAGRSVQGQLTPRERAVLQFLAKAQTNAEIARSLQITRSTVKLTWNIFSRSLGSRIEPRPQSEPPNSACSSRLQCNRRDGDFPRSETQPIPVATPRAISCDTLQASIVRWESLECRAIQWHAPHVLQG